MNMTNTTFLLLVAPKTLFETGLMDDKGNFATRSVAKMLRRIAEMCQQEWWETNDMHNPPPGGNDCFYMPVTLVDTGRVLHLEAVPDKRPFVYLWVREMEDTRKSSAVLVFNYPASVELFEKLPPSLLDAEIN